MKPVGVLGGWKVTKHALDRALERKVSPEDITAAIDSPLWTRSGRKGTLCCHGTAATVVIDQGRKVIITII